ncbi:hypothetical protein LJR232_000230 [Aquipseudomonas alcaligenes]|uniref:hypothetical protein n=1 Tax=Pseudomonas sp. 2023EL-01195 TaxID=3088134 RepID=UPI00296B4046|nr:hypothetical protein [Pseudomonas sp. 2023EL-01195]MDW3716598.1 hypothetical protein [Pseudomonas sp. 2023EL-01195]
MSKHWKSRISAGIAGVSLLVITGSASADVGVGVGISYVFGGGVALGVKAFSNDEDNETVGSVGLDYLFEQSSFRPNIGVAYQGEGYFSGGDVGYNFGKETIDFAVGAGWSNSDDDNKTPAPPPAPDLT